MPFNPLVTSKNICDTFRRYILSTFETDSDTYNEQLKQILEQDDAIIRGPYIQISHNYPSSVYIDDLIEEGILSKEFRAMNYKPFLERKLYAHQEAAIRKIVEGRNIVVSTGTGSGKTECFLIPVLNHLMREKEKGTLGPGVRVMLLYPLNALANDQQERMRDILREYPDITFGTFNGETADTLDEANAKDNGLIKRIQNEVYDRETFRKSPPHILITNYAMLEHLLIKPANSPLFGERGDNHWKYIVLDEAHTYGGSKGSEVSMLLRRLKTTLGKEDIGFILTSATLGDEDKDAEVADFASKLCTAEFRQEDVIRAKYIPMEEPENTVVLGPEFYADIAEIVSNDDVEENLRRYLADLGEKVNDPRATLYDLVYGDPTIHRMASLLDDRPKTLASLSEEMGMPEQNIVDIITTVSATKKLGNRVFNAKYHLFIKGLDGAYVTLKGSERFLIRPQKEYREENGTFQVFQISTCYNCNAIFLLGEMKNNRFVQVSRQSEEFKGYTPYLLVNDHNLDPDYLEESKESLFTLCSECGSVHKGRYDNCQCGSKNVNFILRVRNDSKEKVTKCPVCGVQNTARGLLRQLYLGHDASTSVIGSELYRDLLGAKDHRFLTFSDSRQSAAFFAPYMDDTYKGILKKRTIYETMLRNSARLTGKVPFADFVEMVRKTAELYDTLNEKECLDAVVRECAQNNSYRSLEYQGFLRFEYSRTAQGNEWIPRDNPTFGLNADEVYGLVNTILKHIRDKRSVTYFSTDLQTYDFRRGVFVDDGGKGAMRLLNSQISAYLTTILGSPDNVRKFAESVVNNMLSTEGNKQGKFLELGRLDVTMPTTVYRCSKCRCNYPFSVRSICIRCNTPTLEPIEVNAVERDVDGRHIGANLDMSKHYIRTCVESPLKKLVIKEHTAQLDTNTARNYQNMFRDRKIDALSCSTTFEMGVDIGTLNSVFMRNVPPSPANYVQRAGRAGRGEDSSAFAITFCKEASHDLTYFEDPLEMICGSVRVPLIKTDNVAIVLRHVFATALNFFWKSYKGYPKKTNEFVNQYDALKEYLLSKPSDLKDFLYCIVPETLIDKPDGIDLSDFGWLKYLFEGDEENIGRLSGAVGEYKQDLDILDDPLKKLQQGIQGMGRDELRKLMNSSRQSMDMSDNIMRKVTLDFLSNYNIIPKYGFPVDVVPMEAANGNSTSDLTRDLRLAISEFAPGCEVVVDGRKVRSKYVTTVPGGKTWIQYRYSKCDECGKMTAIINNDLPDTNPEVQKYLSRCSCGAELTKTHKFIKPELGFKYVDSKSSMTEKPARMYSSEISFCDPYSLDECVRKIGKEEIQILPISNGKLVAVNDKHFQICKKCGFGRPISESGLKKDFTHDNPRNMECSNKAPSTLDLGHIFHTDVLVIRFITHPCTHLKEARSILYALIEGFSRAFSIERDEISGCLDNVNGFYSFILFDNTPGGSGYVASVSDDDSFRKVLSETYRLVKECKCGGTHGDSSCYNCLRNYHNQRWHDDLVRGKVIDFLELLEV